MSHEHTAPDPSTECQSITLPSDLNFNQTFIGDKLRLTIPFFTSTPMLGRWSSKSTQSQCSRRGGRRNFDIHNAAAALSLKLTRLGCGVWDSLNAANHESRCPVVQRKTPELFTSRHAALCQPTGSTRTRAVTNRASATVNASRGREESNTEVLLAASGRRHPPGRSDSLADGSRRSGCGSWCVADISDAPAP